MRTDRVWKSLTLAALALGANSGCASMAARWNAYLECKAEQHVARNEFRQSELEALKQELEMERAAIRAQREAELAALKAEREHELACLQDDAERSRQCMLNQTEESIRTTMGVGLDQRVTLGQVQVNLDEMKRLLADRDAEYNYRMRRYEADTKAYQQENRPGTSPYTAAQTATSCSCATCGVPHSVCGCNAPPNCGCRQPQMGPDCANSQPYRSAPSKPYRAPVLPTEIPLMLPVTLDVRMDNVELGPSRTVRRPLTRTAPYNTAEGCQPGCAPPAPACGACVGCRNGMACIATLQMPPIVPGDTEETAEDDAARVSLDAETSSAETTIPTDIRTFQLRGLLDD